MVLLLQLVILLEEILDLVCVPVSADPSLRGTKSAESGRNPHVLDCVAGLDGMMHELKERSLLVRGQGVVNLRRSVACRLPVRKNSIRPR